MHQQDKNLSGKFNENFLGKVFGGHLMREAYEIGNCYNYVKVGFQP